MATITSAGIGNWSVGATWVGGVSPVNGDKVYIAHTSTALRQFSTDAAGYAIGATAITLTGAVAAGSYVIGEAVQFGTTDKTYYPITGWNSVTKVLTIGGAGLVSAIPAVATLARSCGHVVTIDTNTIEGGDDTSTAINVSGTLYWSRTANSQLTVQGELLCTTTATWDRGRSIDPIPTAYTATLKTNRSAALVDGKYGVTVQLLCTWWDYGTVKTTNAFVVNSITAGATTVRVTDGTGWSVGDTIVLGGTGTSQNEAETRTIATITLVSGTQYDVTWAGGLTYAHSALGMVGNLTNNIVNTVYNTTYRSYMNNQWDATNIATGVREMRYVTFLEFANATPGGIYYKQAGLTMQGTSSGGGALPWISVGNLAFNQTLACQSQWQSGTNAGRYEIHNVAMYQSGSGNGMLCYSGGVGDFYDWHFYKSGGIQNGYSEGMRNPRFYDCIMTGGTYLNIGGSVKIELYRCYFYAQTTAMAITIANNTYFESCYFASGGSYTPSTAGFTNPYIAYSGLGALGNITMLNCYINSSYALVQNSTYQLASPFTETVVTNKNANVTLQELYYPDAYFYRENTIISRGKSSIAYSPVTANAKYFRTIYIPASNGVALTIKGRLRKNASYGSATRPTVTLSGLGITPQTFTMTDSVDTWEEFTFTATQSSGNDGSLSLVFTCQSSSTSALAYLDGVLYDPFVQYKDFYGYSYAPTTPALTVDPVIQASEATVAAYTGISISGGTITLTANHSIREIYDYCQYYRVVNQLAPFFTSSDGVNFTSTYNITTSGANITGTGVINMPTKTLTMGGSDVSSVYIYALNGNTGYLNITGLSAHTVLLQNGAGAQLDYQASVTGTYAYFVPVTASGTWKAVVKKAGYDHQTITFLSTTGGGFTYATNTPQKLNSDGTVMYTGSTSALCTVSFTGTTQGNIDIGNGTVPLQSAFDQTEDALITNAGMTWLATGKGGTTQFNSSSGDYLFMTSGWRIRRRAVGDVNATLQAFVISTDGVIVDGTNGGVLFLTSDTPTAVATAVWDYLTSNATVSGSFGKSVLTTGKFLGLK